MTAVKHLVPALWLAAASLLAACGNSAKSAPALTGSDAAALPAGTPEVKVLSNRADLISGGDALVEVLLPAEVKASDLRMTLDGKDITSSFALRPNGRYMGLVTGMVDRSSNLLKARLPNGRGSEITVFNHPNGGPVFSGPQIMPWPCLPGAIDSQCNRPVTYSYFYKSTVPGSSLAAYDPANPPTNVAMTVTDQGKEVPYIVRRENGAQDRGQYMIAVLFDPSKDWAPWAPQVGWNGKTYVTGGSGCGTHHGETEAPDVLDDNALARGYMVWSTALDHNTQNCNLVVQAESLMMGKERVIEAYGPIRYTIASGCSGGAIYQQQAANNYPGLFDGILPTCSFPDSWSTSVEVIDCKILLDYFDNPTKWVPGVAWPEVARAAVSGHPGSNICESWINVYNFDASANPRAVTTGLGLQSCNVPQGVGPDKAYDPDTNPKGVRCDLSTYFGNVLGYRPDGIANRPSDNVGVQYGLQQLLANTITPAMFVDLNKKIGGRDNDYDYIPERTVADAPAVPIAYRSGLFNMGNNMHLPIIDIRGHDVAEIHHDYRSYVMRARLDRSNGHHDNQVIWTGAIALVGDLTFQDKALTVMDAWLSGIESDTSSLSYIAKVKKHKPTAAHDLCTDGNGNELPAASCPALNPYYAEPRMMAGEPFTGDVLKCQLKPLNKADYTQTIPFTDAEWASMQATFATGVCDYSKPGVGTQMTVPWLDYSKGPGGVALGAAPVAKALR
ncbi:MAG: DUF6351 family protein [Pseudomonadota bacterium]